MRREMKTSFVIRGCLMFRMELWKYVLTDFKLEFILYKVKLCCSIL